MTDHAPTYTVVMHYSNPTEGSGLPRKPLSIAIPGCEYNRDVAMAQRAYTDAIRDMMLDDSSIKEVQLWRNDHMISSMLP